MTPTLRRVGLAVLALAVAVPVAVVARGEDPLRVVEAGWSTAGRATGVPPGAVAVGSEVGRTTETAAVRLTGDGGLLRLPVVRERSLYPEDASLQVCRAAERDWTPSSPGRAVRHRADGCVPVRLEGDVALVDVSGWPGRTDRAGFVLVPELGGDTAPRTFRLVLGPLP